MMHIVNKNTCEYCKDCGGCDYIDITYAETLGIKLNNIKELYSPSKTKPLNIDHLEIVPSPLPFGYRTRCQLHVVNGKIGFHKKRSNDLIEIKKCIILDERINKRIKELNFPKNYSAKIELYLKDGVVCERIIEKKYDNIFYQINDSVNKLIIEDVVTLINAQEKDRILELFCGLGNFTYPILKSSPKTHITGVDMRVPTNKKDNPEFIEADVLVGINMLKKQKRLSSFNKLVLDPPRSGADKKVIMELNDCDFEKIIYVSCNPITLIDDAITFSDCGYKWQSMKLFDMFPFTKYLESISIFSK
ncbi:MAG: hypothetical protein WCQ47_06555 [bacterium]